MERRGNGAGLRSEAAHATTARTIGANLKAWSTVAGIGDKAPDLVLQLFDRAIKLDGDQPKYLVQRAFAAIEQSKQPDLVAWRAAADRAMKAVPDYAGGYILDGVVLLFEPSKPTSGRTR